MAPRLVLAELGSEWTDGPSGELVALARALRDAGAEVVHGGAMASVEAVAGIVEQEDPAALVLGLGAGQEMEATPDQVAEVAELVATLPGLPVYGLGELARSAGLPALPADLTRALAALRR
ncbi:hypothetical protein [Amycolatopsis palatopharyngis]|uniref:hypothetical protein n=1 Tax=Amycolatopsis palatopharyngis TaxID=187982 RepID=UPI000E22CABA|nr:hypothetical protein [Amycolatopsis palatopharyngis]